MITNKQIIISDKKPKIYDKLHDVLGVDWDTGVIICVGDTIHCKYDIPPQKMIHELVHVKQQEKMDKDLWWELYLAKPSFRLEQEVEAYKKEYAFICENIVDRNARFEFLYDMAQTLSSEQYGKICTGDEAMKLIQS